MNFRPLITAGIVLGIGLGGFADGIVLHQILQLHNMLSNKRFPNTVADLEINMFWDGLFHAFTWATTLIGVSLLWKVTGRREVDRSGKVLAGSMLMGWGIFNFVEGIVDHLVLQIHHVVQRAPEPVRLMWDLFFVAVGGVLLIAIGRGIIRKERKRLLAMRRNNAHGISKAA